MRVFLACSIDSGVAIASFTVPQDVSCVRPNVATGVVLNRYLRRRHVTPSPDTVEEVFSCKLKSVSRFSGYCVSCVAPWQHCL